MERGITGKLLKKWLQLIKKTTSVCVCGCVRVCVMSISRNIYEVIFCRQNQKYIDSSDDDDDDDGKLQSKQKRSSVSKKSCIASESDSSPDKRTQRKGKRVPPLPPLPVLSPPPPPPSPSTPSTSSIAVASKSLFGSGTGGYNSKPTVSGKS